MHIKQKYNVFTLLVESKRLGLKLLFKLMWSPSLTPSLYLYLPLSSLQNQRFTMQDRVHSTRAGIVWHGSFTEDGCYFLGPSWSLRGEGPARMLRMKRRKGRKSGRRKKDEETERLSEGEEYESGRTRSKDGAMIRR